jgi:calcineurin-like phosphoesterase family protein
MEEHDEMMVENWRAVVSKRDKVYLLGDVGRDKAHYFTGSIRPRLTGYIEVVGGNHDTAEILRLFDKVHGCINKVIAGSRCIITHIPIHPQEMYWEYNIHGHIHENVVRKFAHIPESGRDGEADGRYINACMEHIGFTPQPIEELVTQRSGKGSKYVGLFEGDENED